MTDTESSQDQIYSESGYSTGTTKRSLPNAGVKAGLKTGMTAEFRKLAEPETPEANPLREAIEKLRQPKTRRQRKTVETFPWEHQARLRAARSAAKARPVPDEELPWQNMPEAPKGGSYSFTDHEDFEEESEPRVTHSGEDFPWVDRQLPGQKKEAAEKTTKITASEPVDHQRPPAVPTEDQNTSSARANEAGKKRTSPSDLQNVAQPSAKNETAVAPESEEVNEKPVTDVAGWISLSGPPAPSESAKKPERAPSAPHTVMSFARAEESARAMEFLKPEMSIVDTMLEIAANKTPAPPRALTPSAAPLENVDKFIWQTDEAGYVTDFWVRIHYGQPFYHFRWQGTGYREFDDDKGEFCTKSSAIDCPKARVNKHTGAIEQEQFTGNRRCFFSDGRYEERDTRDRVLYATNGKGQHMVHRYDDDGNLVLVILSFRGSPIKQFHSPDSDLSSADACGYEYRTPRTRHLETLVHEASGEWKLQCGDRLHFYPAACKLTMDRLGNRRLVHPNGVILFEGWADGTFIMRNLIGHIIETRSESGCTTLVERTASGEVIRVIVLNSQGQVVEHTTRHNGQWDSPAMDEVEIDDHTGDYMVSFTTGDEVIRNLDRSQELRNSTDEYKLDADRIIEYIKPPLSPDKEVEMRADLAEIAKLAPDVQHIIYECIRSINDSLGGPTKLTRAQASRVITSMTRQIAHPDTIKQGNKDTCVAANVEKTIAINHPDLYASMVANLAVYGEFTTGDGKTTMKAQRQIDGSLAGYSDSSKSRSPVSEILQTALTRLAMPEGEEYLSFPSGQDPMPDGIDRSMDTGERILRRDGVLDKFSGLDHDAQIRILQKLLPQHKYVAAHVSTTGELDSAWKANGCKPPIYIMVRIGFPSGGEGGIGTHAVSITHIEYDTAGQPSLVYYENQGDGEDHSYPHGRGVPVEEFLKGMQATHKDPSSGAEKPLPLTAVVGKNA